MNRDLRYLCPADRRFAMRMVIGFAWNEGRRESSSPASRMACAMDAAYFLGEKSAWPPGEEEKLLLLLRRLLR